MYNKECHIWRALGEGLIAILALTILVFAKPIDSTLLVMLIGLSAMGLSNATITLVFSYISNKKFHTKQKKIIFYIYESLRFIVLLASLLFGLSFLEKTDT